ncbi:hypothetical protein [Prosthecobacter sp.]|uniref:hypothetical protein n=1 Tax=Prosthecobacter sp. TaxID=1965333 RepID=UPI00378511DB
MAHQNIDITWLEAEVSFGADTIKDKWLVSKHSDGSHSIEVTKEMQNGKNYVFDIPFDIDDTAPSRSGAYGVRTLLKPLDASQMTCRQQITSIEELDQLGSPNDEEAQT